MNENLCAGKNQFPMLTANIIPSKALLLKLRYIVKLFINFFSCCF